MIAFLGGSYDPGQWLALGAILGFLLGVAAARWWYRPVDLRRFCPPAGETRRCRDCGRPRQIHTMVCAHCGGTYTGPGCSPG